MLNEVKHLGVAPQILRSAQNDIRQDVVAVKQFHVYIMTNRSGTLYTGVTSDLVRRVYEHKHKLVPGFTEKYNIDRLVYYAEFSDARSAIEWEKRVKGWKRDKKIALIESVNAEWRDLSEGWYPEEDSSPCSE